MALTARTNAADSKHTDELHGLFTLTAGNHSVEHKKEEKITRFNTGSKTLPVEYKRDMSESTEIFPCAFTGNPKAFTAACGALTGSLQEEMNPLSHAAFSLNVLGDTHPITVIANGNHSHTQAVCQDPDVLHHVIELRDQVIKKYSAEIKAENAANNPEEQRTAETQGLAHASLAHISATVHEKFPDLHTSFTVVIPFTAKTGDTTIRKVLTFGIGNDLVYKVSADQKELTPLKTAQPFEITITTTPANKEQSTGANVVHDIALVTAQNNDATEAKQTKEPKADNATVSKTTIKTVTIPFNENGLKTLTFTPVSIQDFAEGDVIVATTDCIEQLVNLYNSEMELVRDTWKKIRSNEFKISTDQIATLPLFLIERIDTDHHDAKKTLAQIFKQKDMLAAMRSLYDETMALHTGLVLHDLCEPRQVGDSFALVQMPLCAEPQWNLIANFNTFLMILCDKEYLTSKKHGFKLVTPLPSGLAAMYDKVLKPQKLLDNPMQSFTLEMVTKIMKDLETIAEQRIGTLLNPKTDSDREIMTINLYKLTRINPAEWYREKDFHDLYHDWCEWRRKNNKPLRLCLEVAPPKKEQDVGLVVKNGKQ